MITRTWIIAGLLCLTAGCQLFGSPRWEAPAQGSRIVVYRPGDLTGFAKGFMLTLDGNRQAVIGNGEYFVMDVLPGRHVLALEDTGAREPFPAVDLQAHYFRLQVVKERDVLGARLTPVARQAAGEALPDLREAEPYVPPESGEGFLAPADEAGGPRR